MSEHKDNPSWQVFTHFLNSLAAPTMERTEALTKALNDALAEDLNKERPVGFVNMERGK